MSPDQGQDRAVAVETHAFISVARRFTDPAPALFHLVAEMETLPDLDPLLPILDFTLFAEGLEGPAIAGPGQPEVETSQRPPAVSWPATRQSAKTAVFDPMGRETDRSAFAPYGHGAPGEPATLSPWRDEAVGRERSTPSPTDHATVRMPGHHTPTPESGDGRNTPVAHALAAVLAAGAHEPATRAHEPAAGARELTTGARDSATSARESATRAHEPAMGARESAAEETYRGDTTRRGAGRRSPELDTPPTSETTWTEATRTPWSPPQWSWPATNWSSVDPRAPAPVAGWEALSLVDDLANDLIAERPITLLTPDHPITRSPVHPITPSPHHRAPEIRDPAHGTLDPIWMDEVEGEGAASLEPDDVAAMVAAVLYEQARRHGVDLS